MSKLFPTAIPTFLAATTVASIIPMGFGTAPADATSTPVPVNVTSRALKSSDIGKQVNLTAFASSKSASFDCRTLKIAVPGGKDVRNRSTASCRTGVAQLGTTVTKAMVGKSLVLTGKVTVMSATNLTTRSQVGKDVRTGTLRVKPAPVTSTTSPKPSPAPTSTAPQPSSTPTVAAPQPNSTPTAVAPATDTKIILRGHADLLAGQGAIVDLYVNGARVGGTAVSSVTDADYTVASSVPISTTDTIGLMFLNDDSNATEDRNLFVTSVTLLGQEVRLAAGTSTYQRGETYAEATAAAKTYTIGTMPWNGLITVAQPATSTRVGAAAGGDVIAPAAADGAGFSKLSFDSEFDSLSEFDLTGTGEAGKKWYLDRPWGNPSLNAADVQVANGVLTLDQNDNVGPNMGIQTASTRNGNGTAFRHGYFETRMRFDPANFATSSGWPSFWMMNASHLRGTQNTLWGEIDAVEMYHNPNQPFDGLYTGSLWTHGTAGDIPAKFDNYHYLQGMDWTAWHTYGVLWESGKLTWFVDGKQMMTLSYDPAGQMGVGIEKDLEGQSLILGTGKGNPIEVDWVRVWQ